MMKSSKNKRSSLLQSRVARVLARTRIFSNHTGVKISCSSYPCSSIRRFSSLFRWEFVQE
ncbi:hypothetical protein KY285_033574 [Solanum tuberosum]|nr:hypothetical protein KY285_033574 [Solanum tuberosum]